MNILLSLLIFLSFATLNASNVSPRASLVLAGIDSLTQRSCCDGTGYITPLTKLMKYEYGDGGPGYIAFDKTGIEYSNIKMDRSQLAQDLSSLPPGDGYSRYSFDLKGTYFSNAKDDTIQMSFPATWDQGEIIYLIHPNGGTFRINGHTINTDGPLKLGVEHVKESNRIQITDINGDVVVFGGLFLNKSGVAVSRIGKGGDTLAWHNKIDAEFKKQWISELDPQLILLNTGVAEYAKIQSTVREYEQSLRAFSDSFGNTPMILIQPNITGYNQSIYDEYGTVLKTVSSDKHFGFVSNLTLLGSSYEEEKQNGYMADEIHPNSKGDDIIATHVFDYFKKAGDLYVKIHNWEQKQQL